MKVALLIICEMLFGDDAIDGNYYRYDEQGRPMIPAKIELEKLPPDGGEFWNR